MKVHRLSHLREHLLRLAHDPLGFAFPITLELRDAELPGLTPLVAS